MDDHDNNLNSYGIFYNEDDEIGEINEQVFIRNDNVEKIKIKQE